MFKLSVALAAIASYAQARPHLGLCSDVAPMESFDAERYMGTWYEISRDKFTFWEAFQGCNVSDYSMNEDGSIAIHGMGHAPFKGWVEGRGTFLKSGEDANLTYICEKEQEKEDFDAENKEPNYMILDTDYETYSIGYSCGNAWDMVSFDYLWIQAREPVLGDAKMLELVAKIDELLPNYQWFKSSKMTRQNKACPFDKRPMDE